MAIKIPKLAMPIVKILRRDVPRPRTYPRTDSSTSGFARWPPSSTSFLPISRCPMGFHPLSLSATPATSDSFNVKGCHTIHVKAFFRWWDSQLHPRRAVEAVWPTE